MKTRFLSLVFAIIASTCWSHSETIERVLIGELYYNLDTENKTAEVTSSGKNSSWKIKVANIPPAVTYSNQIYAVTSIKDWAFWQCGYLTTITIPESITSIGEGLFYGCLDLTSIEINLNNNTYDSRNNCNAIIETRSNILMAGCKKTVIPNNITSIRNYAFAACYDLTSITIPNSVTHIGDYAFSSCTNLTSITIPNSVISMGYYVFENCSRLPVIDNIRYADTYLVDAVDKTLSSYTIKEGTRWIGTYAFQRCSSLTSIDIPSSVRNIEGGAFSGCTNLTSIEIPKSVISIGSAFAGCSSLPIIDNIRYADTYLVEVVDKTLSSYTIKEGTRWIKSSAFHSCRSMVSIEIPNSVTDIGDRAFSTCRDLASVTCAAIVPPSMGWIVFEYKSNHIPLYVPKESVEVYSAADQWKEFNPILPIEDAPLNIENHNSEEILPLKFFRDGQILILRGNKAYTITGNEL